MLSNANILITGCSRGLGLEMAKQLSERMAGGAGCVVATCRRPETADSLQALAQHHTHLYVRQLDVNQLESHQTLKTQVEKILGKECGLNILINNAGVAPKSTRINLVSPEQMTGTFLTNVVAPLFLTKTLLPLLTEGGKGEKPSLIVNMSSILGSIGENTQQGGLYPYRASKAALNAVTRSLSLDLKHNNIVSVALHPGWVSTDMGGKSAPVTPGASVSGMLEFIDKFRPEMSGDFYDYTGAKLPW